MGLLKNYLLRVIENCSEHAFGQDAVEWAIITGRVTLTGDLQTDLITIMGQPGKPETGQYDQICEDYRRSCNDLEEAVQQSTAFTGLLEEINRPIPLYDTTPHVSASAS